MLLDDSDVPPSVSPPYETEYEPDSFAVVRYVMTSVAFLSASSAFLLVLMAVLLCLVLFWYFKIRGSRNVKRKTFRYSLVKQSDEDISKEFKEAVAGAARSKLVKGLGYEAVPRYTVGSSVPITTQMDINAGHLLLKYIEDNLKNRNKLQEEWNMLQKYSPDDTSHGVAERNAVKNRYRDVLPYDRTRVLLSAQDNDKGSDYINASFIEDKHPRQPTNIGYTYIATQGPLPHTVSDFWQMVWEQNVHVIVMLTSLTEMGMTQSCQYWPKSGVELHNTYEVRLVSEHLGCDEYIVRSFVLRNTKISQSRTVTQFQYLVWSSTSVPPSPTPLLEFRRKVCKAHALQETPLLVHCSCGTGRTGTYCLIDIALNRIMSGAKEMNLSATVEFMRDQRPNMVGTKAQFEFALKALVEETNAMLDAVR